MMTRLLAAIFLLSCSLYVHATHAQLPPGRLQQQQQRQLLAEHQYPLQEQRRHPLAAKEPEAAAAAAPSASAPDPFANFTVGNATAARENALKKALLENYERAVFPWVSEEGCRGCYDGEGIIVIFRGAGCRQQSAGSRQQSARTVPQQGPNQNMQQRAVLLPGQNTKGVVQQASKQASRLAEAAEQQ